MANFKANTTFIEWVKKRLLEPCEITSYLIFWIMSVYVGVFWAEYLYNAIR